MRSSFASLSLTVRISIRTARPTGRSEVRACVRVRHTTCTRHRRDRRTRDGVRTLRYPVPAALPCPAGAGTDRTTPARRRPAPTVRRSDGRTQTEHARIASVFRCFRRTRPSITWLDGLPSPFSTCSDPCSARDQAATSQFNKSPPTAAATCVSVPTLPFLPSLCFCSFSFLFCGWCFCTHSHHPN